MFFNVFFKNKIVKLAQEHEIKDDEITFITENLQITGNFNDI